MTLTTPKTTLGYLKSVKGTIKIFVSRGQVAKNRSNGHFGTVS